MTLRLLFHALQSDGVRACLVTGLATVLDGLQGQPVQPGDFCLKIEGARG